jgi:hypothetical protein
MVVAMNHKKFVCALSISPVAIRLSYRSENAIPGDPNMKYMLLVYMDENAMTDEERQQCYVKSAQLTRELDADGPFAETREQLGGYYIVEAKDLDEAMSIAERIPPAQYGTIEVRPMLEIPGLPEK